jgi:uncharacterized iron-regulated membrane protein
MRRALLVIHRWAGLILGLYAGVIGVSGSVLVFRQDLQAARYPQFFAQPPAGSARADLATLARHVGEAYPGWSISGFDWPTYRRGTFLTYVVRGAEFRTVFSDAVSGGVLGEMPYDWIRRTQDLHFTLLGGQAGAALNGIGAGVLLVMGLTGLVIWWPGIARWARHLRAGVGRGWHRFTWELHGAAGAWAWPWLMMWAITGIYFSYSQPLRDAVNAISPLTIVRAPQSAPPVAGSAPVAPEALLGRAMQAAAGTQPARLVMPFGDRGTFQLVLAREVHGDWDTTDELTFYFDRYTGRLLATADHRQRSAGDVLLSWIGPLHVGSLWGVPLKIVWAAMGLVLPLLFASGVIVWTGRTARAARRP